MRPPTAVLEFVMFRFQISMGHWLPSEISGSRIPAVSTVNVRNILERTHWIVRTSRKCGWDLNSKPSSRRVGITVVEVVFVRPSNTYFWKRIRRLCLTILPPLVSDCFKSVNSVNDSFVKLVGESSWIGSFRPIKFLRALKGKVCKSEMEIPIFKKTEKNIIIDKPQ